MSLFLRAIPSNICDYYKISSVERNEFKEKFIIFIESFKVPFVLIYTIFDLIFTSLKSIINGEQAYQPISSESDPESESDNQAQTIRFRQSDSDNQTQLRLSSAHNLSPV
jgi:hypothetical protein